MNPLSHAVPRAVRIGALSLLIPVLATPACAQVTTMASPRPADATLGAPGLGYADLADLVLSAPVIADVTIRSTTAIKGAEAAGVALHDDPWEMNVLATRRGSAHVPSMLEDIQSRRLTEVDLITGALVREAGRVDVPVPLHEALYALVKAKEVACGSA